MTYIDSSLQDYMVHRFSGDERYMYKAVIARMDIESDWLNSFGEVCVWIEDYFDYSGTWADESQYVDESLEWNNSLLAFVIRARAEVVM